MSWTPLQVESQFPADAIGAGVLGRRERQDVAMAREGCQPRHECDGRGAADAATLKRIEDFPAGLIDRLAVSLDFPVADRAHDHPVTGDSQHLGVAGQVVGQISRLPVEKLFLGLRATQMRLLRSGIEQPEQLKAARIPRQECDGGAGDGDLGCW